MNKWKSAVHGGMCVVMFVNNSAAVAQQAVRVPDGNDIALGSRNATVCLDPTSSTCTVVGLLKGMLSSIMGPIPTQASGISIGGVGQIGAPWLVQSIQSATWTSQSLQAGTWTTQSVQAGTWTSQLAAQSVTAPIGGVGNLIKQNNVVTTQLMVCGNYTTLSIATATTLQIVAASAGKTIYVCDFDISNGGTTTNVSFMIGTGTNCATGSTALGQIWYANANWGRAAMNAIYRGMNSGAVASAALCVKISTASLTDVGVYYDQF